MGFESLLPSQKKSQIDEEMPTGWVVATGPFSSLTPMATPKRFLSLVGSRLLGKSFPERRVNRGDRVIANWMVAGHDRSSGISEYAGQERTVIERLVGQNLVIRRSKIIAGVIDFTSLNSSQSVYRVGLRNSLVGFVHCLRQSVLMGGAVGALIDTGPQDFLYARAQEGQPDLSLSFRCGIESSDRCRIEFYILPAKPILLNFTSFPERAYAVSG